MPWNDTIFNGVCFGFLANSLYDSWIHKVRQHPLCPTLRRRGSYFTGRFQEAWSFYFICLGLRWVLHLVFGFLLTPHCADFWGSVNIIGFRHGLCFDILYINHYFLRRSGFICCFSSSRYVPWGPPCMRRNLNFDVYVMWCFFYKLMSATTKRCVCFLLILSDEFNSICVLKIINWVIEFK